MPSPPLQPIRRERTAEKMRNEPRQFASWMKGVKAEIEARRTEADARAAAIEFEVRGHDPNEPP